MTRARQIVVDALTVLAVLGALVLLLVTVGLLGVGLLQSLATGVAR